MPNLPDDPISRFRESHHRIAQYFALGMTASMIRRQTGISIRRLTIMWNSPAFQDLIKHYSAETEEKIAVAQDAFADLAISNMLRAETMIADKLADAEEGEADVPFAILNKIVEGRADRFGYGKNSTVKVEHDFATQLDRAIARSGKAKEVKVIEGEASSIPALPSTAEPAKTPPTVPLAPQPKRPSFAQVLGDVKRRKVA